MIWLVIAVGLMVAAFGATAGAALITVSRAELTRAVSRRLRGGSRLDLGTWCLMAAPYPRRRAGGTVAML